MRIGRDKAIDRQSTMFEVDRLLTSTGACRSWVGDFFEELLADLTGATRIRTESGADICPDLRFNSECFFECKGIGQSGQGIMYQNRYEKDGRFIESNDVDVVYCFLRHRFGVLESKSLAELRGGLAASTVAVYMVGRACLESMLATRELRRINSRYMKTGKRNGYGSKGYGVGWAFPLSAIAAACRASWAVRATAYGQTAAFTLQAEDFTFSTFVKPERFR